MENGVMASHQNNKEFEKKKNKVHRREADCMFRSLTAGQDNYIDLNAQTHACSASLATQNRVILRDNVFSSIKASLGWMGLVLWLGGSQRTSCDSS